MPWETLYRSLNTIQLLPYLQYLQWVSRCGLPWLAQHNSVWSYTTFNHFRISFVVCTVRSYPSSIVIVSYVQVENGQHLHFKQLLRVLRRLGEWWAVHLRDDIHIKFGRIEGMSTRRGDVVFLRDILDEAKSLMLQRMRAKNSKCAYACWLVWFWPRNSNLECARYLVGCFIRIEAWKSRFTRAYNLMCLCLLFGMILT